MTIKPTWYEAPEHVSFPVDKGNIKYSPLGNEISVSFNVCGDEYHVIIPNDMLDKVNLSIPAVQVGEIEGKVLVSFPATSLGTYTLSIPKSCFVPEK